MRTRLARVVAAIALAAGAGHAPDVLATPAPPVSASFAAAGGEDVTAAPPAITQRLIRAIQAGDQAELDAVSVLGRIPLEAVEGIDLHPDDRMDALAWGPRLSRSYVEGFVTLIRAQDGGASLLRLLQQEEGWVAVFRLGGFESPDPPLYAEAKISPEGHLRDLYLHWRGETLAESTRLKMYVAFSRHDARPLAALLGLARVSGEDAQRWREVEAVKRSGGDPDAIPPLLDAMGEPVRGTRLWAIARWAAGDASGQPAEDSPGLARLRASFPDDPGLQALFARQAWNEGDAAAELAHLLAFRASIAVDPLLDFRACRLAGGVRQWPEAIVACGHAVVALPDETDGWFGLMQASGHAVATPTFIDAVEGFERHFGRWVDVPGLVRDAAMVELAADPLFQGWLEQRLAFEREQGLAEGWDRDRPADEGEADEADAPRPRRRRR